MDRIREHIKQMYSLDASDRCLNWYIRLSRSFLEAGVPEEGVLELLNKHPVPLGMVKRYGFSSGLVPENVAKNILTKRESPKSYDTLAIPKHRVTKKRIAEFRETLEAELRRLWSDAGWNNVESYVSDFCTEETDTEIAKMIARGTDPKSYAKCIQEYC